MPSHAPADYRCPICPAIKGIESSETLITQSDIVYNDDRVTAFISSFLIGKNAGHVIVVPNAHYENVYEIPDEELAHVNAVAKKIAIVMKREYPCTGITFLQNNEPDGGQHAFHYHMHVFPRYKDDNLHQYMLDKKSTSPAQRLEYARKLEGKII